MLMELYFFISKIQNFKPYGAQELSRVARGIELV